MHLFLRKIGYNSKLHYIDRMSYLILLCTISVAIAFLVMYILFVPFMPAIFVQIIYISSSSFMYIMLKMKHYIMVRYFIIIAHMIQLTLAVFLWFPVATGFNIYYFMVPMASFIAMEFGRKSQRIFAILSSLLAMLLFLFSELAPMDYYLYETSYQINQLFKAITIVTIFTPLTFVFAEFARNIHKKQTELEFLANTDMLTQICNRRSLYDTGHAEFEVADKYMIDFSIILMDIDFFKAVNDKYGHPAGDSILRQLSDRISANIRKEDTFSRYGGEEFAVLLHKTSEKQGMAIAQKLLKLVEEEPFYYENHKINITISIGIVHYSGDYKDFDHMMKVADRALYQAKETGRNRIVSL